jgi:RNA polymerase sigma factor (sigma-70 family)
LRHQNLKEPTDEEVREELGWRKKKYYDYFAKLNHVNSMNATFTTNKTKSSKTDSMELADLIKDKKSIIPEEKVTKQCILEQLYEGIEYLSETEQKIIKMHYGKNATLEEIADAFSCNSKTIWSLLKGITEKLRAYFEDGTIPIPSNTSFYIEDEELEEFISGHKSKRSFSSRMNKETIEILQFAKLDLHDPEREKTFQKLCDTYSKEFIRKQFIRMKKRHDFLHYPHGKYIQAQLTEKAEKQLEYRIEQLNRREKDGI